MNFDISEAKELISWLMNRDLSIDQAALVLKNMEIGDSLAISIVKAMKDTTGDKNEKVNDCPWGNVITP
jgi:hypothetical protein